MSNKKPVNPLIIMALALPAAGIYIARILAWGDSIPAAVLGYCLTGFAFGLLQSLFEVRRPYRTAFLSTAIVPIVAYLFLAGLLIFLGIGIAFYGSIPVGYSEEVLSIPSRVGLALGSVLLALVISILVIPFGLIGVGGRLLGDNLLPRFTARFLSQSGSHIAGPELAYLNGLNRALVDRFDLEEIKGISFDLGIDFDELEGAGKSGKARELILHVRNRERLADLHMQVIQRRPDLNLAPPSGEFADTAVTLREMQAEMEKADQAATRIMTSTVIGLSVLLVGAGLLISLLSAS